MTVVVSGFGLTAACGPGTSAPGLPVIAEPSAAVVSIRMGQGEPPAVAPGAHRVRQFGPSSAPTHAVDRLADGRYRFQTEWDGVFLVSADGAVAECWPLDGAQRWAEMVTMQLLPMMATLRGIEVFHAGVVEIDGGACVITGPSGAGKSSTTAHLVASGAPLITDDVVGVTSDADGAPVAHGGSHTMRLFEQEAAAVLARAPEAWADEGWSDPKRLLTARRTAPAMPLRWFCLLERADAPDGVTVEVLIRPEPMALLGATFNVTVHSPARLTRQLDTCLAISKHAQVIRVRSGQGATAADVAAALRDRLDAD